MKTRLLRRVRRGIRVRISLVKDPFEYNFEIYTVVPYPHWARLYNSTDLSDCLKKYHTLIKGRLGNSNLILTP
jgi:hypothetical protein